MSILIDKLILFLCSTLFMIYYADSISFIIIFSFLFCFSLSCLITYFSLAGQTYFHRQMEIATNLIIVVFFSLCLIYPMFSYYLPLLFYDIILLKKRLFSLFSFVILAKWISTEPFYLFVILFAFMALSFLLAFRSNQLRSAQQQLKYLRDTSQETSLKLSHKNKDLMEKQDYEIYLATLKERNRIAREIHDNVGHLLSRSLLQLGAILVINKEDGLSRPLNALKDTLSGAMDSIRSSVHDLHDDSIDLQAAANEMLKDFNAYKILFEYDMGNTVPRNVKYCLISILKEGLSNIARHSNATKIRLILREHPGMYQFLLEDNGTSITDSLGGIGLENIKERVENLQGNLTVSTTNGFRIFITLPIWEKNG